MKGLFVGILAVLLGNTAIYATIIDFETPVVPEGQTSVPGDTYTALGVTLSTVEVTGNVTTGGIITISPVSNTFQLYRSFQAISGSQFAIADLAIADPGTADLLMAFSVPVNFVSVTSDAFPFEGPDVIRLLALQPMGPSQYRVVALAEGLDHEVAAPANLLRVSTTSPVSFAIFEITTEAEGFDDLVFQPIPEPGTVSLIAIGLIVVVRLSRCRPR